MYLRPPKNPEAITGRYRDAHHGAWKRFTLIELAVVIVLLGLLAVVLVPRVFGGTLERARVRQRATHLLSTLTLARDRAAYRREMQVVVVDLEAQRYYLTEGEPEPPHPPPEAAVRAARLDESVQLVALAFGNGPPRSHGQALVRFHPSGWCDPVRVRVRGVATGEQRLVHLNLFGQTRLEVP